MNPTVKDKAPALPQRKLPIRVEIVVKVLEDAKALQEFKSFCHDQQILVETRVYDSYKSRYDRDEIVSLPAFHIYVNTVYQKTFYPAHRPYQIVSDTVFEYKRRIQEKQEKKGRWKKPFIKLWERFMALGVRKTRMEREQEFQEKLRRMSYDNQQADFDRRMKSHRIEQALPSQHRISTWN
jgi:hypothetical protein